MRLLVVIVCLMASPVLADGYLALGTSYTFDGSRLPTNLSIGQQVGSVHNWPIYLNAVWGKSKTEKIIGGGLCTKYKGFNIGVDYGKFTEVVKNVPMKSNEVFLYVAHPVVEW